MEVPILRGRLVPPVKADCFAAFKRAVSVGVDVHEGGRTPHRGRLAKLGRPSFHRRPSALGCVFGPSVDRGSVLSRVHRVTWQGYVLPLARSHLCSRRHRTSERFMATPRCSAGCPVCNVGRTRMTEL